MLSDIVSIIKEDAISKMFDCYESNINLDQAIAAHKCILVSLPESSMASRKAIDFVGSLLLTKLFLAGMKRVNRTPFYVYIDEAHQFTTSVTRDALAMLRKYGVFFTFATQTLDQYDNNGGYSSAKTYQSVLDMCQTIISFKIDKNTATELIPYFQPRYTINDFINIPKYSFIARVPADNNTEYPTLTSIPIPLRYDDKAVIERSLSNYGQRVDSIITQRPKIVQPFQDHKPPEIVVASILVTDGKVLITQSAKWSHKWTIPGGHIEEGETMLEAFKRETFEETGITVDSGDLLYIDDLVLPPEYHRKAYFVVIVFRGVVTQDTVSLNQEAYKYAWIDPKNLSGYDLAQWSIKALQHSDTPQMTHFG
jgi:nucleoside triphosphatase